MLRLNLHKIIARDLPDLWFQAVHDILYYGRSFVIDRGSYAGETRLEYDYFTGHVLHPGTTPLIPDIPAHIGLPNPVTHEYIYGGEGIERSYVEYLMSPEKQPGEQYTYGERLTIAMVKYEHVSYPHLHKNVIIQDKEIIENRKIFHFEKSDWFMNQIKLVIETYRKFGLRNNQMVLQVAQPSDLMLQDPPCLRHIDTRIQDGRLHFFVYFRSWDLYSGLPANLAGIQILKEYMADAIGVADGEMIVESKGAHIYGFAEKLAKIRCLKNDI